MSKISSFKLTGLVPATFTPMKENGDIDYDRFDAYCDYLVQSGFTQIYANGTTGEGFSQSLDERKKVIEKWMEVGRRRTGKLKTLVVQVGSLNLHDTLELTRHAVSVGADAIATVPPLFFKPKSIAALVQYCKTVAAAAPELPFYFYHVPIGTGVQLNMEDFLKAAVSEIPTLVGVKFSDRDHVDMIGCVHVKAPHLDDKRFNIVNGTDSQLLGGLVAGADGGVGSTYNILPPLLNRMIKHIDSGNLREARLDQYRQQQFGRIVVKYGLPLGNKISIEKALMSWAGVDLGPVRAPLVPPSPEVMDEVKRELTDIGFFEWNK